MAELFSQLQKYLPQPLVLAGIVTGILFLLFYYYNSHTEYWQTLRHSMFQSATVLVFAGALLVLIYQNSDRPAPTNEPPVVVVSLFFRDTAEECRDLFITTLESNLDAALGRSGSIYRVDTFVRDAETARDTMEYYKAQAIIYDVSVTSTGEGKSICFRVLLRDTGISPRHPRIDVKAIDQQITHLANDFLGRFAQNSSVTVKNPLIERLVSLEQQVAELASSAKVVGVAAEDRAIPRYGKKVALLVGCNTVADSSLPALKSAESDAQSLNSVLSAQWGFETELIVGSKATRASILARLAAVGEKLTDEDLLVCYFGGYSTERLNGASKIVTYIPYDYSNQIYLTGDDILKALGPSPARHKLVLFDGCHATSGIPRGHTSASNGAGNAPVTMWFGACLPHQFSGESEAGGIFTQAVLRSLREGVDSGKGHVWISQLASSVRQKMPPHQTADLLWVAGDGEVCFGAEVTR